MGFTEYAVRGASVSLMVFGFVFIYLDKTLNIFFNKTYVTSTVTFFIVFNKHFLAEKFSGYEEQLNLYQSN